MKNLLCRILDLTQHGTNIYLTKPSLFLILKFDYLIYHFCKYHFEKSFQYFYALVYYIIIYVILLLF